MAAIPVIIGATAIVGVASLAYTFVKKTGSKLNMAMDLADGAADGKIEFFGSQLGGKSVITYSYTSDPWHLLLHDIYYFFAFWRNWLYIVFPIRPSDSGDLGELAPTKENMFCLAVHFGLVLAQLGFIVSLPFTLVLPLWMVVGWMAAFLGANRWVCHRFLNSDEIEFHSDVNVGPGNKEEQWIFLNGVAAGKHWMKSNLNRLALTFKRPILGIHNRTHGILFDTIECLIQRNFTYATSDVRMCYARLKEKLYDPGLRRVIFILHSQGGIEGGLVLDWLIQELPQDLLMKLEVYTFGCAANHFNNPHRHALSQRIAQANPAAITATTTTTTQVNTRSTTEDDILADPDNHAPDTDDTTTTMTTTTTTLSSPTAGDIITSPTRRSTGKHTNFHLHHPPTLMTDTSAVSATSTVSAAADRAIGHIEHYAHTSDFVARWGVLHFSTDLSHSSSSSSAAGMPRYMGRVFARTSHRGGHQFCQHYLDGMFPLERSAEGEGGFLGALETGNAFMESEVRCHDDGGRREGDEVSSATAASASAVAVTGFGTGSRKGTGLAVRDGKGARKKVKELSRLWGYVNGRSPPDLRG